jgi:hypothetical protein
MIRTALIMLATSTLALAPAQHATGAPPAPQAGSAASPEEQRLGQGEGRAVAEKLADELGRNFVYEEQGKRYAAMLRANASAGLYDSGTRKQLAERMTSDLLAVQKDGHLHVSVTEPEVQPASGGVIPTPRKWPPLIQSAKWIAPGIAYIRFTAFLGTDEEIAGVRAFMRDHSEAKTVIFDLRNHHGGGLAEMDEIFPYLFAAKTPLVTMETRRSVFDRSGRRAGDGPTLELKLDDGHARSTHYALPGKATPLRDATIYLLTSNATASAGEHFALAFKSTGRATLIGEATTGANHFGGSERIGDHFSAFIPVGRTFDIKTGKDWEGAGIAPDIAIDPTLALVAALEKAGLSHDEAVRLDAAEVPGEPVHRDRLRSR